MLIFFCQSYKYLSLYCAVCIGIGRRIEDIVTGKTDGAASRADLEAQGLHADWKKGDKLQLPSVIPAARMKVVRSYLASVRLPSLLSLDPSQLFGADSKAGEPGFSRSAILS